MLPLDWGKLLNEWYKNQFTVIDKLSDVEDLPFGDNFDNTLFSNKLSTMQYYDNSLPQKRHRLFYLRTSKKRTQ